MYALRNLTGLASLDLSHNRIDDASELGGLTNLTVLALGGNEMEHLSGLSSLTGLKYLYLFGNAFESTEGLAGLTGLRFLSLGGNLIDDVGALAGLTELEELHLYANNIADIAPLESLTRLVVLSLNSNRITDIVPLANLTQLERLWLHQNYITDIAPLANLTKLIALSLSANRITSVAPLENLTRLERLWLHGNSLTDIAPLDSLTNLASLVLSSNQIADIAPLSSLTKLTVLDLDSNRITDIAPLANLTQLERLWLYSNLITDIAPLESLTNLTSLDLRQNPLSLASVATHVPALRARSVFVPISPPDLVAAPPTLSDARPDAGESFTLSVAVRNAGYSEAEATTLRYYQSSNNTISASDTEVGTHALGALTATQTSAVSIRLTAPSSEGTYYYGACVDSVAGESITGNNCSSAAVVAVGAGGSTPVADGDYDADEDGLIEVRNLTQLNAIRWDSNGDGRVFGASADDYSSAFPEAQDGMGCPASGCVGYELAADLDFDTDGSGGAGAGDIYWNGGAGWEPMELRADFDGGGHTLANLYINRPDENRVGLFGRVSSGSIQGVGLLAATVTGNDEVGGLVGYNSSGSVSDSYATGSVSGNDSVGGLVGDNFSGNVSDSYATGSVSGNDEVGGLVGDNHSGDFTDSYTTATVSGNDEVGGLVGYNFRGDFTATYATGSVSGNVKVGGLVGDNHSGDFTASYATGSVSGNDEVGGLVGDNHSGDFTDSYWDTQTTGQSASDGGAGHTTAELQSPTGYTGIYSGWNVDLDGDDSGDDPWNFGTPSQYPVLKHQGEAPPPSDPGAPAPDLLVDRPSVSDASLEGGDSFTLSVRVRNAGDGEAPATTLRYYRSTNSSIGTSDTEVGSDAVGRLAASGTSAENIRLTAPSSAGTYYYGACVDSVAEESNTANNCSSAVTVTVSGEDTGGGGDSGSGGACTAGLVVQPGGSCTYKDSTFSVSSSGRGSIAFFNASTEIDARGSTVNGVRWNFHASKNSDSNSWTIHVAD